MLRGCLQLLSDGQIVVASGGGEQLFCECFGLDLLRLAGLRIQGNEVIGHFGAVSLMWKSLGHNFPVTNKRLFFWS